MGASSRFRSNCVMVGSSVQAPFAKAVSTRCLKVCNRRDKSLESFFVPKQLEPADYSAAVSVFA
jgi:hypothetical protein